MTTVTESDLKELKDLILGIDKKLDVYIARTDEKFKSVDQRFDQIEKSIDSVNARLNTFTLGFLSIVGILVTGLLGIVTKVVFFPNP
jgi:tetrahydromethanopterin S-methyltransferase subunit G